MINNILFSHLDSTKVKNTKAVVQGEISYSYEELCYLVKGFADHLNSEGVKRGDSVAIYLPNSVDFIKAFFAISSVGAIAAPINMSYRYSEIEYYIRFSNARYVVTDPNGLKEVEKTEIKKDLRKIVVSDKSRQSPFEDPFKLSGQAELSETDKVLYLFSTGSTGKPKCIARNHQNLLTLAENHTTTARWTSADRILMVIPLSHTYGFGNFISAISAGATIYVIDRFSRKEILGLIRENKITVFPAVPFMLEALAGTGESDRVDASSLKLVISAGSPLPERTFYDFYKKFGIYPRQLYGSSETGVISINMADDIEAKRSSVGRPVVNVEVKVVDDNGRELGHGEEGEIIVRSPSMASGYENLPEETKQSFRSGFYFTGDIGKIDEEGYIFITGRKKLFINISGFKVDPIELEQFLLTNSSISEVAVTSVRDNDGKEMIKACIVPADKISRGDIVNFCKGKISDQKIPRVIEFRDSLPKSPTGKILRYAL